MRFLDGRTGEINEVNSLQIRLGRLKKRLSFFTNWREEVSLMVSEVDNIMVTLTYKGVDDWRPKQVTEFIRKVKRHLGAALLGYFWVAEMQERGAVHYHVIFVVRKGTRLPKPDEEGYWTYGMTRIERVQHVYAYLSKYLQKDEQKASYPKGIRIFGFSIFVLQDWVRRWRLPKWLQDKLNVSIWKAQDDAERIKLIQLRKFKKVKGGYQADDIFFSSPYSFSLR